MRIPLFAFALMVLSLLALSTGLFLTRAKETPRWFQYEVLGRDGKMIMGGTTPANPGGNPYYDGGAEMPYADGTVWFHIRMLGQIGETEKIAARAGWLPRGEKWERVRNMPEREFLYSPGDNLKIPVDGYGNLEIKGHFESTLPENVRMGLYPEDGKLRIDPPVILVREKEMLGKFDNGGGQLSQDKSYFAYGEQSEGWYVFSAKPIALYGRPNPIRERENLGEALCFHSGRGSDFRRRRMAGKHTAACIRRIRESRSREVMAL